MPPLHRFSQALILQGALSLGLVGGALSETELPEQPLMTDAITLQLVEVRLNGRGLEDFQDFLSAGPQRSWLAIEPIVEAAEAESGQAEAGGRVFSFGTGPSVRIDVERKALVVDEARLDWPLGHILQREDQLFLSDDLLASLFGLDVQVSVDQQTVRVSSERPLPVDVRRLRERRWERYDEGGSEGRSEFSELSAPYTVWGTPRGDLDLSTSARKDSPGSTTSYSGAVNAEAGFISNELFFSGSDEGGLSRIRWIGGRESPSREAFGIDGLSRLQFGDVSALRVPLQGGGEVGRGIEFSTAPLDRAQRFDATRIAGDAIPGWDAELYRGSELIDFQRIQPDGRFRFESVPLEFGNNDFRVMLYGPEGQVREQRFERSIAGGQVPPGELQMRGSLSEPQRRTIPIESSPSAQDRRLSLRGDYGLSQRLTVSAFAAVDRQAWSRYSDRYPQRDDDGAEDSETFRREMAGFAVRPAIGSVVSELSFAQQSDDGAAFQSNASTTFAGFGLYARYKHYTERFVSRDRERYGGLVTDSLRFRASHGLGQLGSASMQYERLEFESGDARERIEPRLRHRIGALNISHELRLNRQGESRQSSYRLLGSVRRQSLSARFQLRGNGSEVDDLELASSSASLDWDLAEDHRLGVQAGYSHTSDQADAGLRYSQDFGPGRAGFNISGNDAGGWATSLNLTIGLGVEPDRGVRFIPPETTGTGAVSVRVFRDHNANGEFDPAEDDAQAEVGVLVDGREHPARTNEQGQIVVRNLPTSRRVEIELDQSSMNDPFLVPDRPRLEVQPRKGQTQSIEFDLGDSATLSGYLRHGGEASSGIVVIAERQDTPGTQTTESFSDGFFSFDQLAAGEWRVRVSDEDLPDEWTSEEIDVNVEEGQVSDNNDIRIEPNPKGESE